MRQLTVKQKKLLDKWIESQVIKDEEKRDVYNNGAAFAGNRSQLNIEDLPMKIWEELEKINDTEVLYTYTNHYIQEKSEEVHDREWRTD